MLSYMLFLKVEGKTHISVQFTTFHNPQSKDYVGECCDNLGNLWCFLECDNWFKFCFTTLPIDDTKPCIYSVTTYVLGDDRFNFPGFGHSIGNNILNPIQFLFDGAFVSYWNNILSVWM